MPTTKNAPVAQWIERLVADQKVAGSSPAGRTPRDVQGAKSPCIFVFRLPEFVAERCPSGLRCRSRKAVGLIALEGSNPSLSATRLSRTEVVLIWKGRIVWPSARDWKSRRVNSPRGFESLPFRHCFPDAIKETRELPKASQPIPHPPTGSVFVADWLSNWLSGGDNYDCFV
jgi:hypothetical protein